jgi:hypothetical protein
MDCSEGRDVNELEVAVCRSWIQVIQASVEHLIFHLPHVSLSSFVHLWHLGITVRVTSSLHSLDVHYQFGRRYCYLYPRYMRRSTFGECTRRPMFWSGGSSIYALVQSSQSKPKF